ncbi:hypothetical protein R1sor_000403 [Riccia sorocarpa]|uniref:Uncharacterized protein n=1 Tax=Riccia sorocarpa TaxID=122646 RepID=A0ABD3GUZ8_9MARC
MGKHMDLSFIDLARHGWEQYEAFGRPARVFRTKSDPFENFKEVLAQTFNVPPKNTGDLLWICTTSRDLFQLWVTVSNAWINGLLPDPRGEEGNPQNARSINETMFRSFMGCDDEMIKRNLQMVLNKEFLLKGLENFKEVLAQTFNVPPKNTGDLLWICTASRDLFQLWVTVCNAWINGLLPDPRGEEGNPQNARSINETIFRSFMGCDDEMIKRNLQMVLNKEFLLKVDSKYTGDLLSLNDYTENEKAEENTVKKLKKQKASLLKRGSKGEPHAKKVKSEDGVVEDRSFENRLDFKDYPLRLVQVVKDDHHLKKYLQSWGERGAAPADESQSWNPPSLADAEIEISKQPVQIVLEEDDEGYDDIMDPEQAFFKRQGMEVPSHIDGTSAIELGEIELTSNQGPTSQTGPFQSSGPSQGTTESSKSEDDASRPGSRNAAAIASCASSAVDGGAVHQNGSATPSQTTCVDVEVMNNET